MPTRLQGGRCAAQPTHTNAPKAESTLYAVNSLLQNAARASLKSKPIRTLRSSFHALTANVGFCFVLTSCTSAVHVCRGPLVQTEMGKAVGH